MTPAFLEPAVQRLAAWQDAAQPRVAEALAVLRGWGWPAAVGGGLIAAAMLVALVATPGLERQADAERAEASQLRHQALQQAQRGAGPAPEKTGAEAFRSAFPAASARAARVAALLARAPEHGVAVRRAEFRYQPEPALGLASYRIVLPAEGSYSALRSFVTDGLRSDPALALDAVRLNRADDPAAGLRAELRFTLYTQLDAAAAAGGRR
jgi:hypothetical protein